MGDLASCLGCLGEGRLHARAKTWAQGDPPHQGLLGLVGPRALKVTEVTQTIVMRLWPWGLAIQPVEAGQPGEGWRSSPCCRRLSPGPCTPFTAG